METRKNNSHKKLREILQYNPQGLQMAPNQ